MRNIIIALVIFASACSSLPIPFGAKLEDIERLRGGYKIGRVAVPSEGFESYRHTKFCWVDHTSLGECRSIFPSPDGTSAFFQVANSSDIIYHKKFGSPVVVLMAPRDDLHRVEWAGSHATLHFRDRNAHIYKRQVVLPGNGT